MIGSVVDLGALLIALAASLAVAVTLLLGARDRGAKRLWLLAAAAAAVLILAGLLDLARESPRETHGATVVVGALLAVLGGVGATYGTRRMRAWLAWPIVIVTTFVLLFAGALIGATLLPRYLPF